MVTYSQTMLTQLDEIKNEHLLNDLLHAHPKSQDLLDNSKIHTNEAQNSKTLIDEGQ